jgi:hypothetical protein
LSILRVRSLQIGGTWSAYTNLTNAAVTTIGADAISIEYAYTIEVTVNDSIGTALGRANGVITATILPAVRGADIRNDRAAFGRIAATANRLMLPPDWDIEHKGQTLDQRFSAIAHTHSLAQVSGITPAAIGAINKAGDTLTGVLFHTKGIITTGIASNFRGQAFGNAAANYHTVRPVRCDTGSITGFPIYGSGLAWSTDDTHSYIDVPYVAGDIYVGGGNGNTLNWQTKLWSAQNFDPATKVNKSGDTMAGTLTSNAQYGMVINSSTAESSIQYNQSAVMKWVVGKGVGGIGEYFGWYYANGVNTNRMALTTDGALQIISGGGNYSEGIRISSAPNGYSDIQFGASPTVGYGAQAGQWFLGKKANGYFCIAQAGNQDLSNCGLLISPNNTDVFINNYRTYHAGNFTRGTWTPSGGSDGDMFVQYV